MEHNLRHWLKLVEMPRFSYQMKTWSPYNGLHKSLNTDPPVTISKQRGGWQLAWGDYVARESTYRDALEHVNNAISMGDQHSVPIRLIAKAKPRVAEAREPYPTRKGNNPAAYRQFIIDVMIWSQRKYGSEPKFTGTVGESLSKSGIRVAQQMEQDGVVQVSLADDRVTVQRGGRHTGLPVSQRIENHQRFVITPGPNWQG